MGKVEYSLGFKLPLLCADTLTADQGSQGHSGAVGCPNGFSSATKIRFAHRKRWGCATPDGAFGKPIMLPDRLLIQSMTLSRAEPDTLIRCANYEAAGYSSSKLVRCLRLSKDCRRAVDGGMRIESNASCAASALPTCAFVSFPGKKLEQRRSIAII